MPGYIRQDVTDQIAPDQDINAEPLDDEFDALQAAFASSGGHRHNGAVGEGAPITVTGPLQDFIFTNSSLSPKTNNVYSLGTSSFKFKDLFLAGAADIGSLTVPSVTITGGTITGITDLAIADGGTGSSTAEGARTNLGLGTIATQNANAVDLTGGTINGTPVGATIPSSGAFTTISGNSLTLTGNISAGVVTASVVGNLNGTVTGSLTGNASTAATLQTARTISLTGGVTGSVSFNGSSNVSIASTVVPSGHVHDNASTSAAGFMSTADKTKLNGIEAGAQVNTVTSVAGRTGDVTIGWDDVGSKPAVVASGTTQAAARTSIGLGSLATVTPTGTASADTYLRGDGAWSGVLGVGQTWQTPTRAANTDYTNTTGKPIMVSITVTGVGGTDTYTAIVGGVTVSHDENLGSEETYSVSFIVPAGNVYRINTTGGAFITVWAELR